MPKPEALLEGDLESDLPQGYHYPAIFDPDAALRDPRLQQAIAKHKVDFDVITSESTEKEVIDADLHISNFVLKNVLLGWGSVDTIPALEQMANLTMKMLRERRKLTNKQYGAPTNSKSSEQPLTFVS